MEKREAFAELEGRRKRLAAADKIINNLELDIDEFETPVDPGVYEYVRVLREHRVATIQSCQGGEGHVLSVPTVQFAGGCDEGFRALALAMKYDWPVSYLRRFWMMCDGEPVGPSWELTFRRMCTPLAH